MKSLTFDGNIDNSFFYNLPTHSIPDISCSRTNYVVQNDKLLKQSNFVAVVFEAKPKSTKLQNRK